MIRDYSLRYDRIEDELASAKPYSGNCQLCKNYRNTDLREQERNKRYSYIDILPLDLRKMLLDQYLSPQLALLWRHFPPFTSIMPPTISRLDMVYSAEHGYTSIMSWLLQHDFRWRDTLPTLAALGRLETLRWTVDRGAPIFRGNLTDSNHITDREVLCCMNSKGVLYKAAEFGNLEVIRWAYMKVSSPRDIGKCCSIAAAHGHLNILAWAKACEMSICPHATAVAAAAMGQIAVLEWISNNYALTPLMLSDCLRGAAKNGDMTVIDWLLAHGATVSIQSCATAAYYGHVPALRCLQEKNSDWAGHSGTAACAEASRAGHLEILQWCRESGAQWDYRCIANALLYQRDKVLEWCRAAGAPEPPPNKPQIDLIMDSLQYS